MKNDIYGDARPPFVHTLIGATIALAIFVAFCGDWNW